MLLIFEQTVFKPPTPIYLSKCVGSDSGCMMNVCGFRAKGEEGSHGVGAQEEAICTGHAAQTVSRVEIIFLIITSRYLNYSNTIWITNRWENKVK